MDWILALLPEWATDDWYGNPIWVWAGLPVLFIGVYFGSIVVGHLVGAIIKVIARRHPSVSATTDAVVPPVEMLAAIGLFKLGKQFFPISDEIEDFLSYGELVLGTLTFGWLFFRIIEVIGRRFEARLRDRGRQHAVAVVPPLKKLLKATVIILGMLFLLQNLGFDVAALIAGLGIGGVAIALASQKTVENLLGGVMVTLDQPVRVGDFIAYAEGKVGTVEDIGLRTTKIRTNARTRVAIPNGDFAQIQLENLAARDKMLLQTVIGVRYDTSAEQMQQLLNELRQLLQDDPKIGEPYQVRFIAFSASSLDVEIFTYGLTSNWGEFLGIRENIFLRIMEIVQKVGTDFAFPSQTIFLEPGDPDSGPPLILAKNMLQGSDGEEVAPFDTASDSGGSEDG